MPLVTLSNIARTVNGDQRVTKTRRVTAAVHLKPLQRLYMAGMAGHLRRLFLQSVRPSFEHRPSVNAQHECQPNNQPTRAYGVHRQIPYRL